MQNKKAFRKLMYNCIKATDTGIKCIIFESAGDHNPYYQVKFANHYILMIPNRIKENCLLPLISCHTDTVRASQEIRNIHEERGCLYNRDKFDCLGGDDRAGIAIALSLIRDYTPAIFLFCDGEETTSIGSTEFIQKEEETIMKTNCYIGLDRRGANDLALYDYVSDSLNKLFILENYEEKGGSVTDVSSIASEYPKPTVNLSVGFYNEHTQKEYVNLLDAYNTYMRISRVLPQLIGKYFTDMKSISYTSRYNISYWTSKDKSIWEVDRELGIPDSTCLECPFYHIEDDTCDYNFECIDEFWD